MRATLRVVEIFDSLQGEGYWTGVPMTFVRLAGCNAPVLGLECTRWCDAPESWDIGAGIEMTTQEIVARIDLPRLCITGGEPLLQADGVVELVAEAHLQGVCVHLETNGTLGLPPVLQGEVSPPIEAGFAGGATAIPEITAVGSAGVQALSAADLPSLRFDWAVVSPKPPDYVISPEWEGFVDEIKLVADEFLAAAAAERLAAAHPGAVVSIQPEYGGDRASIERAVALVMSHPEWRLSLQTHKSLGIR